MPTARAEARRRRRVKVFGQTFFKKFAVGKAEPYGLKSNAKRCKRKLGKQGVLVPSGDRSGPVYVATSVGAGRLPLADSTRGEPPFCGPPRWVQETGKRQPSRGAGERAGAQQAQKRTARLGGPSSMQGRLIGRYKRPAASLPGRRGFPGRRGWSGSQRSGGRRTCTPAHRQCPRPKSAPPPYRRPFGPFPAG